jgi:hypothetical protein
LKAKHIQKLVGDLREYASHPGYSHSYYVDTMRQAADVLAERAASPAESVQSKELWSIFAEYMRAHREGPRERLNAAADQIDTWVDTINANIAVHAEGRRRAMEELAKEKERAEELQARLDAALSGKLAHAADVGQGQCSKVHAKVEEFGFNTQDCRLVITERYGKQELRMHHEDARFIVEAIAHAKRITSNSIAQDGQKSEDA